ncbi:hypothetical protein C8J57DRAFT_1516228 [Mycena rebaudengoi]|nr:hypothetical protein C8J57DRAFT_1516228 [Mycena rebaudengoi]
MKLQVAKMGWIALCDEGISEEAAAGFEEKGWHPSHTLATFFGEMPLFPGFRLVKYSPGTCPLMDQLGKICGMFAGCTDDPDWMTNIHDRAVATMEWARSHRSISEALTFHRQGN